MKEKMAVNVGWLFVLICLQTNQVSTEGKIKRQIYREQVLPHSGGKIPEEAFRADRLALNRLNKEGIAVPDGVLLEHRSVHSHPHTNKHDPEDEDSVIKIIQQSEHRFAPAEGQYHNESPLTVSSTYLIRKPIGHEETNIRTPEQQRPLHQTLMYKQNRGYQHNFHYNPPRYQQHPTPPPLPQQRYPTRYNRPESKPQAYHPIPVPFELPNKEIQQERYFLKPYGNSYPGEEDISGRIDWPLLFGSFDRLPTDLNSLLRPNSYDYDSNFQFYNSYESIPHFDEFNGFFGERLVRKSAEGSAKGTDSKKSRHHPKELPRRVFYKRVAEVQCSETDSSKRCQVY